MAKPFLHLGDVGFMFEGIGRGGCARNMRMERAAQFGSDTRDLAIMPDQRPERPAVERFVEGAGGVVPDRPEKRARPILDPTIFEQIVIDQADGMGACWNEPDLVAFAMDTCSGLRSSGLGIEIIAISGSHYLRL